MKKNEGKLIVITGPDGCGKATQAKLLLKNLKQNNFPVETMDFPQYKKNFFGKMAGDYLIGKFGNTLEIDPHLASMLYAGDRWESMSQIIDWLDKGKIVVCDRYIGDNFLHQGSKIANVAKREEFFQWLYNLEFNVFTAQHADITFYLDVSLEISLKLLEEKNAKKRKDYTGGEKDGHENEKHLRKVREISEDLIKRFDWIKVDCIKNSELMPPEEISVIIWKTLKSKLGPL